MKKGRKKKASYLLVLKYSFAPKNYFRYQIHSQYAKMYQKNTQELWGCTASHLPKDLDLVESYKMKERDRLPWNTLFEDKFDKTHLQY